MAIRYWHTLPWPRTAPHRHGRWIKAAIAGGLAWSLGLAHAQALDDAAADAGGSAGGGAPATALPAVVVDAQRPALGGSGGLAGFSAAPIATTPLAIDRIGAQELADRAVNSLSAAIRTEPSVGDNYNTFGYIEALQIRGFALNELLNTQRDGMNVSSHLPVALEDKEAIEILKGVSGMLAGASAPGGIVNYVLKQPTAQELRQIDVNVSERGSVLLHGDFGGHWGAQGEFGYRINVAAEERRPQIDNAWSKRTLASGFFDWRIGPQTLLQWEFEHQQVREISVPGYGLLDSGNSGVASTLPPPIDPRINLNAQPWTQPFESTQTSGSLRLAQRLSAQWDLALRLGTQRSHTNDRIAFPDGCSYVDATRNSASASNYYYLYNGMCGNYNTDIYQYISDDEVRNTNATDVHVHGRLAGAGLEQELTLGLRSTRYSERYPPQQTYTLVGTINVFAPLALPAAAAPNAANTWLDTDLDELYAFDVVRLAQRWSGWFGGRATRITQDSTLTDGTQATSLQQHLLTPWLGVGVEPWPGGFAYAAAGSGVEVANAPNHPTVTLRADGSSWNLRNPGQVLPAQRSRQVELGFKQHSARNWNWEAALFRIEKPFVDNVPVSPTDVIQVAGARAERHQGLELQGEWQALNSLRWRASASLIDARTIQAVDPSWIGKPATNVAPWAASLQQAWTPAALGGLEWSNLLTLAGHKTVLPDGSVALPSYWQWDTNVRYEVTQRELHWTWRAGVDNVSNRRYWREAPMAPWGSIYLFPAAARTVHLGLSLNW